MVETILGSVVAPLLLAILSGLTFLAYRHRESYQRLAHAANFYMLLVSVLCLGVITGAILMSYLLHGFVAPQHADAAKAAVTRVTAWAMGLSVSVSALGWFMALLKRLPRADDR